MPLAFMASARPDPQTRQARAAYAARAPPPPARRQARADAVPLPAPCLPLPCTGAPAGHATPAQGAASGQSGAALQPGEPPRPAAGAALSGPPRAAPTGRAASRAPRRWRHTAKPSPGADGAEQGAQSVATALCSAPRGARKWRRPQPVEAEAGGWIARTARTAAHDNHQEHSLRRARLAAWPQAAGARYRGSRRGAGGTAGRRTSPRPLLQS